MEGIPIIEVIGNNASQTVAAIITVVGFHVLLPEIIGHAHSGSHVSVTLPEPVVVTPDGKFMGANFTMESSLGFTFTIDIQVDKATGSVVTTCEAIDKNTGLTHNMPAQAELRADMRVSNLRRNVMRLRDYPESDKFGAKRPAVLEKPPFERSSLATNLLGGPHGTL